MFNPSEQRMRCMAAAAAAFVLLVMSMTVCAQAATKHNHGLPRKRQSSAQKHVNADLEIAKVYMRLKNWSEAEEHFVLAARDPLSQTEALTGLENARSEIDAEKDMGETAPMGVAKLYEDNDIQDKAEAIYQSAATNSTVSEDTRKSAAEGLARILKAQGGDRFFSSVKVWSERIEGLVESFFWVAALLLSFVLAWHIGGAIFKRRKAVLFQDFITPSEELSRSLSIIFKQARSRMQNPSLSPIGAMSAVLVQHMPTFSDEVEPIEDLEIGGAKLPFAAIARLWGEPRIQISGGFDGLSPLGSIFATIKRRGGEQEIHRDQIVRTGVPSQQRGDLFDFAYDLIVRSSTAYDDA